MVRKPHLARFLSWITLLLVGQLVSACALLTPDNEPPAGTSVPTPLPTPLPTVTSPADAIELSFETIEQSETSGDGMDYTGTDPKMVVLKDSDEVQAFNQVSTQAWEVLQGLDFKNFFAIAVFQGQKTTNMYGATIQSIHHTGNTIIVTVHFTERDPEMAAGDVVTSPYHLVKVARPLTAKSYTIVLVADGQELQRYTVDF